MFCTPVCCWRITQLPPTKSRKTATWKLDLQVRTSTACAIFQFLIVNFEILRSLLLAAPKFLLDTNMFRSKQFDFLEKLKHLLAKKKRPREENAKFCAFRNVQEKKSFSSCAFNGTRCVDKQALHRSLRIPRARKYLLSVWKLVLSRVQSYSRKLPSLRRSIHWKP